MPGKAGIAAGNRYAKARKRCVATITLIFCLASAVSGQVPVQHKEGLVHGFLVLRTLEGETIADGDLVQNVRGDRVTSRLTFHFKDGSIHDETAIFSQSKNFLLLSDHLIQKGPAFEHPVEMKLERKTGVVEVRYSEDGKEKVELHHLQMPINVANGLILTLMKNLAPNAGETELGFVAATPKPRMVKLVVTSLGEETFLTGGERRKATHFVVKIHIGGITGALADMLGKKPADTDVWILEGEAPAFVRSEGPLALGGPKWRIELVSPSWSHSAETETKP